jgi:DNA-binding LytR/AlgR family response regulator
LEADQIYTKIHTDAQTYLVRTALQSIFDKLADSDFIRTHRSFIINKAFVSSFDMDSVCICAQVLPISKANKANVLRLLS